MASGGGRLIDQMYEQYCKKMSGGGREKSLFEKAMSQINVGKALGNLVKSIPNVFKRDKKKKKEEQSLDRILGLGKMGQLEKKAMMKLVKEVKKPQLGDKLKRKIEVQEREEKEDRKDGFRDYREDMPKFVKKGQRYSKRRAQSPLRRERKPRIGDLLAPQQASSSSGLFAEIDMDEFEQDFPPPTKRRRTGRGVYQSDWRKAKAEAIYELLLKQGVEKARARKLAIGYL